MAGTHQLPQHGSRHKQRIAIFIYAIVRDASYPRNKKTWRIQVQVQHLTHTNLACLSRFFFGNIAAKGQVWLV